MNIQNIKTWIAALRSGKYTQGRGRLTKVEDGICKDCCLGVACKLYIEDGNSMEVVTKTERFMEPEEVTIIVTSYNWHTRFMPPEVKDWLGLKDTIEIVGMNDSGESFEKIAQYLENLINGT